MKQRHQRIFEYQKRLAGVIWAAFLGVSTVMGGVQAIQNNQAQKEVAAAEMRGDFWRVTAGAQEPKSTRVEDRFAIDLRDRLGPIDPNAERLPTELTEMRVLPNTYGGIENELGFNPFDNTNQNCKICGKLSSEMQNKLLQVKQGAVEQVVANEVASHQPNGIDVVPGNLPVIVWMGVVYLGGGIFALVMAVRKDCHENDYTASELNWNKTGASDDNVKRFSKLISPGYFLTVAPLYKQLGKSYDQVLEKIGLEQDQKSLEELFQQVRKLPPREREDVLGQLEELQQAIARQVRDHLGKNREFHADEAELVRQEVQIAVEGMATRFAARREVMDSSQFEDPSAGTIREVEAALQESPEPERRRLGRS